METSAYSQALSGLEKDFGRTRALGRWGTKQRSGVMPGASLIALGTSGRTKHELPWKNEIPNRWEDIPWRLAAKHVFELQKRVFDGENRGDKRTVSKIQQKIADSFFAKALAVRQVAQLSSGRKTAGIDGVKSPDAATKLRMASGLSIHHQPSAVRRKWIPKPGKDELRPLGIPNLIDRAHQALLVMILEPQWEAHFSKRQYGFRKGRGTHDAIGYIQQHLRKAGPKWVLEIDIERFFDRIDQKELLRRLNVVPPVRDAIRRILTAGVLDMVEDGCPEMGTPQGGPLSPLLANIALAGLENHLEREFRREYAGRITALKLPSLAVYADDAVVLHRDRHVVEWSKVAIQGYLDPLGLKLSENKTRISHTQLPTRPDERAGFEFLGFHIQHHWARKKGGKKTPYIIVTPSARSVKRFYDDCANRIDKLKLSRKLRGARQDRQAAGRVDPVTSMIRDLNRRVKGWTNYFCTCNAKQAFNKMDNLLHGKLWGWSIRRFNQKRRQWIIDHLFSGVEVDEKGKPLRKRNGLSRQRNWVFKSPFVPNDKPHATLHKLADTPIRDHNLVRPDERFMNGKWRYWQQRMRSRYPGTPLMIPITAYKRQKGTCVICANALLPGEMLAVGRRDRIQVISHLHCSPPPSAPNGAPCVSPVR
ncbi:MAG: alcohol dehydrogenase [Verrucomicrobiaceae bacterium]|nr:MAG: alcohol dehydrogenase [Verrucomicrobiaceae bacterium]